MKLGESMEHNRKEDPLKLVFAGAKGKPDSEINVVGTQRIAGGTFGIIYRADVEAIGDRKWTFVLKEFKDQPGKTARQCAEDAKKKYDQLASSGVETWKTYRLEKTRPVILMSDGETGNSKIVSHNFSRSRSDVGSWEPFVLQDIESAADKAVESALRAVANGLRIHKDAWMASLTPNQNGQVAMKYFVGDVDNVDKIDPQNSLTEKRSRRLCSLNLLNAQDEMMHILGLLKKLPKEEYARCASALNKKMDEALAPYVHDLETTIDNLLEFGENLTSAQKDIVSSSASHLQILKASELQRLLLEIPDNWQTYPNLFRWIAIAQVLREKRISERARS